MGYRRNRYVGSWNRGAGFYPAGPGRESGFLKKLQGTESRVSKDSVASHKKFQEKYNLPFTLLSDTELQVIQAYDVWQEKNMYGKKTMGVVRSTYLIDEKGVIVKAFGKVKAAENPQQMLEVL